MFSATNRIFLRIAAHHPQHKSTGMASYTEEDVAELERLVGLVLPERPNIKNLLEAQIANVKSKLPKVLSNTNPE